MKYAPKFTQHRMLGGERLLRCGVCKKMRSQMLTVSGWDGDKGEGLLGRDVCGYCLAKFVGLDLSGREKTSQRRIHANCPCLTKKPVEEL